MMATIALRAYLEEVRGLIQVEAIEEAIGHCRHILQHFPKHIGCYRLLGEALLTKASYKDAIDVFLRVLSAQPDDLTAHAGLSTCYDKLDQPRPALHHMSRALEQSPKSAELQGEVRRLYERLGQSAPDQIGMSQAGLARLYLRGRMYNEAVLTVRAALKADPNRPDLLVLLANALYSEERTKTDAGEVALQILSDLPEQIDANYILAALFLGAGRPSDARAFVETLSAVDPERGWEVTHPRGEAMPADALQIPHMEWNVRTSGLLANDEDYLSAFNIDASPVSIAEPTTPGVSEGNFGSGFGDPFADLFDSSPVDPIESAQFASVTTNTPQPSTPDFDDLPPLFADPTDQRAVEGDMPDWFRDMVDEPSGGLQSVSASSNQPLSNTPNDNESLDFNDLFADEPVASAPQMAPSTSSLGNPDPLNTNPLSSAGDDPFDFLSQFDQPDTAATDSMSNDTPDYGGMDWLNAAPADESTGQPASTPIGNPVNTVDSLSTATDDDLDDLFDIDLLLDDSTGSAVNSADQSTARQVTDDAFDFFATADATVQTPAPIDDPFADPLTMPNANATTSSDALLEDPFNLFADEPETPQQEQPVAYENRSIPVAVQPDDQDDQSDADSIPDFLSDFTPSAPSGMAAFAFNAPAQNAQATPDDDLPDWMREMSLPPTEAPNIGKPTAVPASTSVGRFDLPDLPDLSAFEFESTESVDEPAATIQDVSSFTETIDAPQIQTDQPTPAGVTSAESTEAGTSGLLSFFRKTPDPTPEPADDRIVDPAASVGLDDLFAPDSDLTAIEAGTNTDTEIGEEVDPLAWMKEAGIEIAETPIEPRRISEPEMKFDLEKELDHPLAWMESAGVSIQPQSPLAVDVAAIPAAEPEEVDPLAWMREAGVSVNEPVEQSVSDRSVSDSFNKSFGASFSASSSESAIPVEADDFMFGDEQPAASIDSTAQATALQSEDWFSDLADQPDQSDQRDEIGNQSTQPNMIPPSARAIPAEPSVLTPEETVGLEALFGSSDANDFSNFEALFADPAADLTPEPVVPQSQVGSPVQDSPAYLPLAVDQAIFEQDFDQAFDTEFGTESADGSVGESSGKPVLMVSGEFSDLFAPDSEPDQDQVIDPLTQSERYVQQASGGQDEPTDSSFQMPIADLPGMDDPEYIGAYQPEAEPAAPIRPTFQMPQQSVTSTTATDPEIDAEIDTWLTAPTAAGAPTTEQNAESPLVSADADLFSLFDTPSGAGGTGSWMDSFTMPTAPSLAAASDPAEMPDWLQQADQSQFEERLTAAQQEARAARDRDLSTMAAADQPDWLTGFAAESDTPEQSTPSADLADLFAEPESPELFAEPEPTAKSDPLLSPYELPPLPPLESIDWGSLSSFSTSDQPAANQAQAGSDYSFDVNEIEQPAEDYSFLDEMNPADFGTFGASDETGQEESPTITLRPNDDRLPSVLPPALSTGETRAVDPDASTYQASINDLDEPTSPVVVPYRQTAQDDIPTDTDGFDFLSDPTIAGDMTAVERNDTGTLPDWMQQLSPQMQGQGASNAKSVDEFDFSGLESGLELQPSNGAALDDLDFSGAFDTSASTETPGQAPRSFKFNRAPAWQRQQTGSETSTSIPSAADFGGTPSSGSTSDDDNDLPDWLR